MAEITIIDIAREAGVSIKSVSRVLNREKGVGADTRARIEALIAKRGYSPNVAARALSSTRNYMIGIVVGESALGYYYFGSVQIGALRACRAAGYNLVVEQSDNNGTEGIGELISMLKKGRFDGLILPPPWNSLPKVLDAVESTGKPYVRIAPDGEFERSPYVFIDDQQASYDITGYLWDRGHRRIAFIEGPVTHSASHRRKAGWVAAMEDRGGDPAGRICAPGDFTSRAGFAAAEALFALPQPPTAIFAANDMMALGVLAAASKHGLSLPRDLSVVGFDDIPGAETVWPPITTVHQPISRMAEAAVELLIQSFGDPRYAAKARVRRLDYHIIERESVAPPRR